MAWSEYMLDASFRGVRFDVIQTRDSVSRSVAVHEYPYQDGGDVEDLGRQPRNSRMTALFWGDTYEQQLQAFIVALDTYGSAELIHRFLVQCLICNVSNTASTTHADNVDHCYVELVFLEATPATRFLCKSSLCQNWTKYAIKFRGT
ncbi:DNA circularization N-terminal domain-containing protein [Limnobaculum xujianqingii]|uniref:DNA circularization N-terminal domain-containing protein n=1 Tax=Limnobaculum xujianqingii TaxID=2738837 RepID=UPI001E45F406|nr:DNA circularization N-terminal domain-containing protein [Limnobaculum xujianqingii]